MNTQLELKGYKNEVPVLQIFELKQLAEMEDTYKNKCKEAIRSYKNWHEAQKNQTDIIELIYGNLEGIMLRRYAEETIKAYWVIRTDFRRSFKGYIQKHCS